MQTLAQKTDGKRRQVRKANLSPRRTKRHLPQMPTVARVNGYFRPEPHGCHSANGGNAHKPPERAAVLRNVSGARALCTSTNGKRRESFAKPVSKVHLTQRELQGLRAFRRIEILLQQAKTPRSAHGSHAQLHPRTCATHAERRSTTTKRNGQIARSL